MPNKSRHRAQIAAAKKYKRFSRKCHPHLVFQDRAKEGPVVLIRNNQDVQFAFTAPLARRGEFVLPRIVFEQIDNVLPFIEVYTDWLQLKSVLATKLPPEICSLFSKPMNANGLYVKMTQFEQHICDYIACKTGKELQIPVDKLYDADTIAELIAKRNAKRNYLQMVQRAGEKLSPTQNESEEYETFTMESNPLFDELEDE